MKKTTTGIVFSYSDGSYEYAGGDHAQEVMDWLNAAQSMLSLHGGSYTGRKMIQVPKPELEPISSIAERVFPEEVKEIKHFTQHIDADRTLGPTDWDRECQEAGRFNDRHRW